MTMFAEDDAAMQQALSALDTHASTMRAAGQTAERIKGGIAANDIAGSDSAFRSRVDDWISNYNAVMQKFQQLTESLRGANQSINTHEENAQSMGSGWDGGSGIAFSTYNALVG